MEDKNIINFDQCVHGYDHGHKMLNSSVQLPKETLNMLLKMSDASISGFSASSLPYITGFPLNEIGAYVLSKTWPAPELERPGCVWTQSIIIDFSDLAQISDLSCLLDLFKKPRVDNFNSYGIGIGFNNAEVDNKNYSCNTKEMASILSSIYKSPVENVIFPRGESAEKIILMIWSQQWPKLRRSFSFRTLVPASSNNYTFDIGFSNSSRYDFLLDSTEQASWVITATKDLNEQKSKLKEFLWFYGPYCSKPRESYCFLVKLYNAMNNKNVEEGLSDAMYLMIDWKGIPSQLLFKMLSTALFFLEENKSSNLFISVSDVMSKLRINEDSPSSLVDIFIGIMNQQSAKKILNFIRECNSDYLKRELYRKIPISKLILIFDKIDSNEVLNVRPDIFFTKDYWNKINKIPESVYEFFDNDNNDLKSLVNAVGGSKNYSYINELIYVGGAKVVKILLENMAISYRNDKLINIIVNHKECLQKSFYDLYDVNLDLLCFISVNVDKGYFNHSSLEDDWAYVVSRTNEKINISQFDLAVFLFKRAFNKNSIQTERLIRLSLDLIIEALKNDNVTYMQWREILEVIPEMKWWEWDKCEHVLNSVINLLLDKRIYLNHNTNITSSFELKERVMKLYKSR